MCGWPMTARKVRKGMTNDGRACLKQMVGSASFDDEHPRERGRSILGALSGRAFALHTACSVFHPLKKMVALSTCDGHHGSFMVNA